MEGQQTECPACSKQVLLRTISIVSEKTTDSSRKNDPIVEIPHATEKGVPNEFVGNESSAAVVRTVMGKLIQNIEEVIVGKTAEITLTLVAYLAEGHVLLEDVPGVAKTMLARALSRSVECGFHRIQCTPDLLPNDITGASIFNPKTSQFEVRPGPLFSQIVLVDEINRATPRSQSALLEAMAEKRVTVDSKEYDLDDPFFLIATQNPVDHEGTFPLPEAQLDRFLIRLSLGYPTAKEEADLLDRIHLEHPIDRIEPVTDSAEIIQCRNRVRGVYVDPLVRSYIVDLVRATRENTEVALGGSPRASISLYRTAQAYAAIRGYDYILPDDVKRMAPYVLPHRIIIRPESRIRGIQSEDIVEQVLQQVSVPIIGSDGGPG
jgi:MoxR-like ATPase